MVKKGKIEINEVIKGKIQIFSQKAVESKKAVESNIES
jgi:hypothetical protein